MSKGFSWTGDGLTDPPHLVVRRTTHAFRLQGTVTLWSTKVVYEYALLAESTELIMKDA